MTAESEKSASNDDAKSEDDAATASESTVEEPAEATEGAEPTERAEEGEGTKADAGAEKVPPAAGAQVEEAGFRFPEWTPTVLAIALPIAFFFLLPPLSRSGLWDPYELNVADLARRIALNLFHAGNLALEGADNSMPHLNDLGRPELPFTSMALGFKLFGLHEWAGRAPLAVWGTAGVLALYGAVRRLVDRRAALYSAAALTSMPLYFVQARTMLGDIVTMAGVAMAFSGLAVAVFDAPPADAPKEGTRARLAWLAVAVVGLVVGYYSRGALLGLAVPLGGIGLAWLVSAMAGQRAGDGMSTAVSVIALLIAAASLAIVISAISADDTKNLSMPVGAMLHAPAKYPTFDYFIGYLGHALAPWSAFIPFAMGRLLVPPVDRALAAYRRESFFRVAIVVGSAMAFFAHGFLGASTDLIAFCAPAILAAACGIAIRDFERGAHGSIAVGVGTGVLLGLLHHDFHALPAKAFKAFAIASAATFPETFADRALSLWWISLFGFAGVAFLTWVEKNPRRTPFDPKNYLAVVEALRDAWDGLLALVYFALIAGASLAGLAIWVGTRTHAKWLPTISVQVREYVVHAWWLTALVPLLIVLGMFFAVDTWLWTFGRAQPLTSASLTRGFEPFEELFARIRDEKDRPTKLVCLFVLFPLMVLAVPAVVMLALTSMKVKLSVALALALPSGIAVFLALGLLGDLLRGRRAAGFALGGVAAGFVLCFFYYPALANQLSPKEVFESYETSHKTGEPLGLFGVGGRTAAYYAGGAPSSFSDVRTAYDWLAGAPAGQRRYLALRADELPRLNQLYREHAEPRENLPILDARSSQILLAASSLRPGEKNQNPLDQILLSTPPKPQHPLGVNMEDKLYVIGFDLTDQAGRHVDSITPGRKVHFRTYYKVLAPVQTEWEGFIHIDGFHRRHNGDHKPMDGRYPMSLWLPGDVLVDDHEFSLEPNFSPGTYTIYFGLFVGETRLKVKSGPSDGDNRIIGGPLRVL